MLLKKVSTEEKVNAIENVPLNAGEEALFKSICWNLDELAKRDDRRSHFEKLGELAESLLKRGAISEVRLAFFFNAEMNIGGYGKSRREVFEKTGVKDRDILRHHDFMKYLRYFIFGPDLPKSTIDGFCKIIEEDVGTSGMVLMEIREYVRKEVRDKRLKGSDVADEFFKLAHEIGSPSLAEPVRSAAMSVRT